MLDSGFGLHRHFQHHELIATLLFLISQRVILGQPTSNSSDDVIDHRDIVKCSADFAEMQEALVDQSLLVDEKFRQFRKDLMSSVDSIKQQMVTELERQNQSYRQLHEHLTNELTQAHLRITKLSSNNGGVIRRSCREIRTFDGSAAPSGEYSLITSTGRILRRVYCEMGLNGGGYTFIHPFDLPSLSQAELNAMFTDTGSFLLRMRQSNGLQKYGVLQQLSPYRNTPLSLQVNSNNGYNTPLNVQYLGSNYLYFGFLPISLARTRTQQGIRVNGVEISFINGDANPNSYFALFPDFSESAPSTYALTTAWPMYTTIINNLRTNPSRRVIPDDFFTFFESHFGGGGLYTQSDSRQDSLGVISATIGFR